MSSVGRCSIVPFSSIVGTPRPFLPKTQAARLKDSIRKLTAYGETALFDATYEAIGVLEADGKPGKRAVITMTDGFDNTSRRRVEEVIDRAKEAGIPLYLLGFGRDGEVDEVTMAKMAKETGGKYFPAKSKDALLEIFENLAILLHDDGIDEETLKQIAAETGGQYFPAKNVAELKLILAQVTQNIQRESYEIVFESLVPRADGTQRDITLKLVRRGAGGADDILDEQTSSYQVRGLVVAEMNHFVYLFLLIAIGGLIALPALLRKSAA
jgi:VWFA-related protein